MMFFEILRSLDNGLEIPLQILLITTPVLFVGILLGQILERRSVPTFWASFALRHTFAVAVIAIIVTLAFGSRIPALLPQFASSVPGPPLQATMPTVQAIPPGSPAIPPGPPRIIAPSMPSPPSLSWTRAHTFTAWAAVSGMLLAIYLVSALALAQVVRRAEDVPEKWKQRVQELCHAFGGMLYPRLKLSSTIISPMAINIPGVTPAVILLPQTCNAEDLTNDDAITVVLAHEIAHLARNDGRWNLAIRLFTVLFWFQPLAWVLASRMERAAEFDCDAEALRRTSTIGGAYPPRKYASSLIDYAEAASQESFLIRSTAVQRITGTNRLFSRLFLQERIERIMEKRSTDSSIPTRSWRYGITTALSVLGITSVAVFGASAMKSAAQPATPTAPAFQAATPEEEDTGLSKRISADFRDMPVEDAITEALKDTGIDYKLSPSLKGKKLGIVTMRVTNIPIESVLRLIFRGSTEAQNVGYRLVGKTVFIEPVIVTEIGFPDRSVRVSAVKKQLTEVLDSLFGGTGLNYTLDNRYNYNKPITVDTGKAVDFPHALQAVLNSYPGMVLRYQNTRDPSQGVYIYPAPRIEWEKPMPPSDTIPARSVSLDLNKAPLRGVLEQVLTNAHLNYSISPEVSGSVTFQCSELPVDDVLKQLLKQADKPATYYYYKDEGVIYITKPH